jgi:hypothetical protein
VTETTTKSPPLTLERAEELISRLWGHRDWKVYRTVGSEIEGVARAARAADDSTGRPAEDRLYVINDGRIVSVC